MIASARTTPLPIVDRWGNPITVEKPRPAAQEIANRSQQRQARATYDAAKVGGELEYHWANADAYDADSANNREIRLRLVHRSRYEFTNNPILAGVGKTHCDYSIGIGPTLRMQSRSQGFNQTIETLFWNWLQAIGFPQKLWCMAHAKLQDGEAFAIAGTNIRVNNRVKLDIRLIETEQCQTPDLVWGEPGKIDGITFDEWGNPATYQILPQHPGASNNFSWMMDPEDIPAVNVLHWFTMRRPGQHRGIPEFTSALNVGACSRRFREAVVKAAERAADFSMLMETQQLPDGTPPDEAQPFSSIPIERDVAAFLPEGWKPYQMKAEHPNAVYAEFCRQQASEVGRPISMPVNLVTCDSSNYSFASGKLDYLSYFGGIDVERDQCNRIVLDPLFALWWAEAVGVYGFNAEKDAPPPHGWNWPQHPVADIKAEAAARDTNLRNGSATLNKVYADSGLDFEDELPRMAEDYGVTPDAMRARLLESIFPAATKTPLANSPDEPSGSDDPSNLQPAGAAA